MFKTISQTLGAQSKKWRLGPMLDEQKSTMPLGMLKLNVWFFLLVKLLTGRLGFYSSVHTHNGLPNSQINLVF